MIDCSVDVVCKCCGELILKTGPIIKVRNKIMLIKNGRLWAVCKGCGTESDLSDITKKVDIKEERISPTIMVRRSPRVA